MFCQIFIFCQNLSPPFLLNRKLNFFLEGKLVFPLRKGSVLGSYPPRHPSPPRPAYIYMYVCACINKRGFSQWQVGFADTPRQRGINALPNSLAEFIIAERSHRLLRVGSSRSRRRGLPEPEVCTGASGRGVEKGNSFAT